MNTDKTTNTPLSGEWQVSSPNGCAYCNRTDVPLRIWKQTMEAVCLDCREKFLEEEYK